jgi:hypothetical protein
LLSVIAHVFQNGTCVFPVEFTALVDVGAGFRGDVAERSRNFSQNGVLFWRDLW